MKRFFVLLFMFVIGPAIAGDELVWSDIGKPITLDQAVEMTENFTLEVEGVRSFLVSADALNQLLDQPSVRGVRIYNAKSENGSTLVFVGTDGVGQDLVGGVIIDDTYYCPPWCQEQDSMLNWANIVAQENLSG